MVWPTVILTLVVISLVFFGFSLRILFVKDGEFRGTCATNNPMLKNELGDCPVCGKKPEEDCKKDETERGWKAS